MMKIVHISDFHVTGHNFVKEWGDNAIEMVNEIKPEFMIITGDLTDEGYVYEYEKVMKFLERFKCKKQFVVPGNHDAQNEGYKVFEYYFGTRFPYYENDRVVILGIDSTEPDVEDAHIGRENYPLIEEKLKKEDKRIKILFMHHHLIPIPATGRERNIPVDAGDVLKICIKNKIHLILCGHKHYPWIWRLETSYFVTAGTASTARLKGFSYPSFNVITVHDLQSLTIEIFNVKDKKLAKKREIRDLQSESDLFHEFL